ncbi:hypothetical protein [Blastococcus mobilis]|uniref:hypothetical protein n=1 Tax=Blastococcus mobilis TaxID=1938746 RepID=UPI000B786EC2|nr:hypothetical protein [Blastococcus mobilis]
MPEWAVLIPAAQALGMSYPALLGDTCPEANAGWYSAVGQAWCVWQAEMQEAARREASSRKS